MGIEHHFQEEIQSILQKEYDQSACFLKYQTPFDVSLCFRLLRQQGYHVSAGNWLIISKNPNYQIMDKLYNYI
ncbi:hypothetical protein MTR67_042047 [Solanum verrucosum]|uniref:Terpene synthase N-terminal domain-containing protein n=1 Tax=Solanum verrucosum TaxID=315347 RepID=A0AAF0ZQT2_SOLVR|nr:hypothetical protein MTR67_042047 [Solanum verrucosum]